MAESGTTPDTGGAREPGGATRPVVMRTATVRATSPDGTTIRVRGRDESWTDEADLSVADGDSLIVQFSRPGYVTATRTFKGNRVAVALHPDSVNVRLESNVPAQVYLLGSGARPTQRLLGTTGSTVRLPTGTHRLLFRAPDQADWPTTQRMPQWGETYRVRKTDFVADGTLVVTVPGSWAFVSVDGGPNADTPLRVDRLSVGTHNLRITRDGFATINDTVVIRPGQRVTKSYTLRPVS
jgi:hypothetical protein